MTGVELGVVTPDTNLRCPRESRDKPERGGCYSHQGSGDITACGVFVSEQRGAV